MQRHRLCSRDGIVALSGIVETAQEFLNRALPLLQRSDPIPKLLPQVRLGRMPRDSPALQAIISSWLEAFVTVLKDGERVLDVNGVLRLDPNPRLAVLVEAGLVEGNDPQVQIARSAYATVLQAVQQRAEMNG
ncbi:MAG: hypothetical protein ABJB49_03675 [Nitrospirota bacterium]